MKNFIFILLSCLFVNAKAQLVVSDPGATTAIVTSSANQISTIQSVISTVKKSNEVLSDVKESSKKLTDLTKKFHDALKEVNNVIATSKEVREIFALHNKIINIVFSNVNNFASNLKPDEYKEYRSVLLKGVEYNTKQLSKLKMVLKPDFYKMSDAERLAAIQKIKSDMQDNLSGTNDWIYFFKQAAQARRLSKEQN